MHKNKILIVEPNRHLVTPYNKFPAYWSIQRSDTIETALKDLRVHNPELIFLSTSFSLTKSIRLLDAIKNFSYSKLIPIIFVVDFSHRIGPRIQQQHTEERGPARPNLRNSREQERSACEQTGVQK